VHSAVSIPISTATFPGLGERFQLLTQLRGLSVSGRRCPGGGALSLADKTSGSRRNPHDSSTNKVVLVSYS
jgi:hypothetical protein